MGGEHCFERSLYEHTFVYDLGVMQLRLDAADRLVELVEDVVTSGGAAVATIRALREAGLEVRRAVCVVDREEGGVDALAREGVRLTPLFTAADVLSA